MRNKAINNRLLNKIRRDLRCWEAGAATPAATRFALASVVTFLAGFSALAYFLDGLVLISTALLWMSVNAGLVWLLVVRYGKSWAQEVDSKLARYQPLDEQAWGELKQSVICKGVTLHAVQRWYEQERDALYPPAEQEWKVLQDKKRDKK